MAAGHMVGAAVHTSRSCPARASCGAPLDCATPACPPTLVYVRSSKLPSCMKLHGGSCGAQLSELPSMCFVRRTAFNCVTLKAPKLAPSHPAGPLLALGGSEGEDVQHGIISFGIGCAQPGVPGARGRCCCGRA